LYSPERELARRIAAAREQYKQALFRHRLRPFDGSLALIFNESHAKRGPGASWRRYVRGELRVRTIPGDHDTAIRAHALEAAQEILQCIGQAVVAPPRP
jgi:thioesterase domain-containing protein